MMQPNDAANNIARLLDALVPPAGSEGRTAFLPAMNAESYDSEEDEFGDVDDVSGVLHGADSDDQHSTEESGHRSEAWADVDADVHNFGDAHTVTLAAVDANMTRLGVTEHGLVVAVRAASTTDTPDGQTTAHLVRTGPLHLRLADRGRVLQRIGEERGSPEFFVRLTGDAEHPIPVPKAGAANHSAIFADRIRNHVERVLQVWTVERLPPGAVLLLDSSLTQRTRDTTPEWWEVFVGVATERDVSLVAVSKKSTLSVRDRPVSFWLDDHVGPGYRCLTPLLRQEDPARASRILGNLWAVRFNFGGPTLRVDVLAAGERADREVLDAVVASCAFRRGMPEPLVRAHALAYIPQPAFRVLQADAVVTHHLDASQDEKFGPAVYSFAAGRHK